MSVNANEQTIGSFFEITLELVNAGIITPEKSPEWNVSEKSPPPSFIKRFGEPFEKLSDSTKNTKFVDLINAGPLKTQNMELQYQTLWDEKLDDCLLIFQKTVFLTLTMPKIGSKLTVLTKKPTLWVPLLIFGFYFLNSL